MLICWNGCGFGTRAMTRRPVRCIETCKVNSFCDGPSARASSSQRHREIKRDVITFDLPMPPVVSKPN